MGKLLHTFDAFDLWEIEQDDLIDFTTFVLRVYYGHHLQIPAPVGEVSACIREDETVFLFTHFYALKTKDGRIFGTINVGLWNGKDEFAFTREYNIDLNDLIKTYSKNLSHTPQVWHIGRFAIDRQIIKQDDTLHGSQGLFFRLLLTCAFSHICSDLNNVMIAECDEKLHRVIKKFDIFSEALSEEHFVLGSAALAIVNTGAGLLGFYERHRHLLGNSWEVRKLES